MEYAIDVLKVHINTCKMMLDDACIFKDGKKIDDINTKIKSLELAIEKLKGE